MTRSGGTAAFDVHFATADGTASTADGDYVAKTGTVHFDAGVTTQTVSVVVNGDTKVEPNETYSVNLSGATNGATISHASGVGTIVNDDAPAGSVAISDATITEGNNGSQLETFTVTRSGGNAAFDVHFATADGTATTADGDYVAKTGTVHFDAGVTTQTVSVVVNGDTKVEPNETYNVNLSGATKRRHDLARKRRRHHRQRRRCSRSRPGGRLCVDRRCHHHRRQQRLADRDLHGDEDRRQRCLRRALCDTCWHRQCCRRRLCRQVRQFAL